MSREAELEAKLVYYSNIELFGVGLKPEEEKDLWETRAEYNKLLKEKHVKGKNIATR